MIPVLTAAAMRAADRHTIEQLGLPGPVLMENAGAAVAAAVREEFPQARHVTILCGKGNNGGDGFVAARRLADRAPAVYLLGSRTDVKGDAALHLAAFERGGGRVHEVADEAAWEAVRGAALRHDVVVDALLGTGLREAPSGLLARAISDVVAARPRGQGVLAVDLPSGLPSDDGGVEWDTVRAAVTVTFAAPKVSQVLPPACERVGVLRVADIGIPATTMAASTLWLLERGDAALAWPPRAPGAHKGTFGHVLVIGGSVGKTGAAGLAALGALRAGAGLVTVATGAAALPLVAAARLELMTETLPLDAAGGLAANRVDHALELAAARDAVVLGPGLGGSSLEFARAFAARCPVPLVLDADALNAHAAGGKAALRPAAPAVLTPHPGEMARLLGADTRGVQARRVEAARELAASSGAVVALKGERTVVARPDGRAAVNPTGNPGLATGGTGDVLAGIAGALLARGCDPWTAATAAVYVHGLAGDHAAERLGQESMLAGDVAESLSSALRSLHG